LKLLADFVADNPNGIESSSPALADAIGLRRVANQIGHNPEGVKSNAANGDATPMGLKIVLDG
jgi:hypothetical protein